jgi:hypothetical protein
MENFEINILIECVAQLRIIKQRIENVNDDKARELCEAVESIDNAIDLIECEGITVESKDAALQQAPVIGMYFSKEQTKSIITRFAIDYDIDDMKAADWFEKYYR